MKLRQFTFKTKYFISLRHTLHVQIMYLGTAKKILWEKNNYFHVVEAFNSKAIRYGPGLRRASARFVTFGISTLKRLNVTFQTLSVPFHLIKVTSNIRINVRRHC